MPEPRKGETKKDFVSRCMGSKEANKTFPDADQRFAFCNSVFEGAKNLAEPTVARHTVVWAALSVAEAGPLRTESLMGRDYLVVPAVLVQGQILRNNLGTTLLPDEALTDAWAEGWNGIPVIVQDHPSLRGVTVSARSPEVLDSRGAGFVFHAHVERNGVVQLKAEVWLDIARAAEIPELNTIMERLKAGQLVELSTGFATEAVDSPGVHNGQVYERVLRPLGADHLAIFVEKTGACSIKDGCGLGANKEEESTVPKTTQVDKDAANAAGAEYRLLLLRLKSLGMTNVEIGKGIGRSASSVAQVERGEIVNPAEPTLVKLRELLDSKLAGNAEHELSDQEKRSMLGTALENKFAAGADKFVFIDAVFSEQQLVIFGVVHEDVLGSDEQLFQVSFEMADNGEVTFTDPEEVTRRIVYELTTNIIQEGKNMADSSKGKKGEEGKPQKPAENAAAGGGDGTPAADPDGGNKPAANLDPKKGADGGGDGKSAADGGSGGGDGGAGAPTPTPATADDVVQLRNELKETRAELKAATDAINTMQEITAPVVVEREAERQTLVETLGANEHVPFDKVELEAKPLGELRKLYTMSRGASYAGSGGPQIGNTKVANAGEQLFVEPVMYFDNGKKKEDE